MRVALVFCLLLATVLAAPQDVVIVKYENEILGIDGYKFAYENSDGSAHEEKGELKNRGAEDEALSVEGSFTWIAPDGQKYTVKYTADENGFQPFGDHIPKAA